MAELFICGECGKPTTNSYDVKDLRKFDLEIHTAVRYSTKRSLCEMPEDYGKEER